ncbi:SDR family NAD(P)-dependent oxidoreductase [soil metagenome]
MKNLKGKTAIVTGGARDIGRQISLKLAEAGVNVCINYFDAEAQAKETLQMIKDAGGNAILVHGDMTKTEEVNKLVDACTAAFGKEVGILVNVAGGLMARKTLDNLDEAFWDLVMDVNLKTVYLLTKAVAPLMPEGSAIVNFTSQAARDGGGFGAAAYSTAKGGVMTFTRAMAKELGPKGIRVNAIAPGMINTTFHDTFTKPEVRTNVAAGTPLKREGDAAEVADLVLYLASGSSSFINGTSIDINGGTYFS